MLNKTLLISLILLVCDNYFSQVSSADYSHLICKYKVEFLIDSTDTTNKKEEIMTLLVGNHISLYKSDQKAMRDSLSREAVKNSINSMKSSGSKDITIDLSKAPRVNLQHEVLFKNDQLLIYDKVFKYLFSYEVNKNVVWTLTKETKRINDYLCYKAVGVYGKRTWIAWYTKSIPIPEGPYVFKGLPGLIVSLNDNRNTYSFQLIYLKNEKREIQPMKNAVNTTYEKFVKARKDSKDNATINAQSLMHRDLTKEELDLINRNTAKRNNFLD